MPNSLDKVIQVISKPPKLRQDFEIQTLLPWLRKKSQLFSRLKTDYLKDIVRNCGHVTYDKDEVIIKQGEFGDCFYIILCGKIGIYIINKDKIDDDSDDTNALVLVGSRTADGALDRSKLGNYVCPLGPGVPFGEVALMSDDCIRTASIISEEKTDLLMVDRALYNRAVKDVLAREFEEKAAFIKDSPLFSTWAPRYKKQLAMALYKESFPYESALVRQGDPLTNIYFIISGQVEMLTDTSQHVFQYPKVFMDALDENEKFLKKLDRSRPPTDPQYTACVKKKDHTKNTKMCYLAKNESIGEMEVLLDLDTYVQTAICTEKTDVLVLEMKHYERLFTKKHQRTIDAMKQMLEIKINTRITLLGSGEEVPLLHHLKNKVNLINNPKAPPEKSTRDEDSVLAAERQFFNHTGPLVDIDGPGSVFYMIRVREKSKQKSQNKNKRKQNGRNEHMHAISLPQSLIMAAQMAGATKDIELIMQNAEEDARHDNSKISAAGKSARSFRRIQSAVKPSNDNETEEDVFDDEKEMTKSLPERHAMVSFDDEDEDASLSFLESRVRDWLCKDNPRKGPQVAQLRRLPVQELDPQPKPGKKIVIRKRNRSTTSHESARTEMRSVMSKDEDDLQHYNILIARS
ncbi:Hypothetical predicted protein [Mytilus galloprovincialis]|uniref:Cyclic nucleotide-binding domain-containing protein n=1 Tax=Mytilus galloprovincialis TaxID=29158 RepID=A0A8B6FTE9_MYTGA|nr:Hypothetical predicted protein [Mytilus galloprovincialis]